MPEFKTSKQIGQVLYDCSMMTEPGLWVWSLNGGQVSVLIHQSNKHPSSPVKLWRVGAPAKVLAFCCIAALDKISFGILEVDSSSWLMGVTMPLWMQHMLTLCTLTSVMLIWSRKGIRDVTATKAVMLS